MEVFTNCHKKGSIGKLTKKKLCQMSLNKVCLTQGNFTLPADAKSSFHFISFLCFNFKWSKTEVFHCSLSLSYFLPSLFPFSNLNFDEMELNLTGYFHNYPSEGYSTYSVRTMQFRRGELKDNC